MLFRSDLNKFNFNGNDLNVNFTNSSIQIQNKTDENLRVVDIGQIYNNNGYLLVDDVSGNILLNDIKIDLDKFNFSNNKLLCDVSGQVVDISGQTLNVNTISGYNLETTQQQIKTDLDKLTFSNNKLLCDVDRKSTRLNSSH